MNIPISKPIITEEMQLKVAEVLGTGCLAQGQKVARFEQEFAARHNARYGVAMSSCTAALVAIMMAHGIGRGDNVLIPSFSFFATASCVLAVGAEPRFVDIDPVTFCMDPDAAEEAVTLGTKAIMPVHLYGHIPEYMDRIKSICEKNNLVLLEDACQAHGAKNSEGFAGTWGDAAFSFYATKNMTTGGEGGMVLTQDFNLAERLRMIRNQGMGRQYQHMILGYNFRMTEIQSAMGIVQLESLADWNYDRHTNALFYSTRLTGVELPEITEGHVFHQYTVRFPSQGLRDRARRILNEKGIGARVYYEFPIHTQPAVYTALGYPDSTYAGAIKHWDNKLPETVRAADTVLSLPVHPSLTQDELDYIAQEVNALC